MQTSICIKISKFILHACSIWRGGAQGLRWVGITGVILEPLISRSCYNVWRGLQSEKCLADAAPLTLFVHLGVSYQEPQEPNTTSIRVFVFN